MLKISPTLQDVTKKTQNQQPKDRVTGSALQATTKVSSCRRPKTITGPASEEQSSQATTTYRQPTNS